MAGQLVHALEDECPGHIGGAANDLAVHEVAHSDGKGANWGYNGHIVKHMGKVELHLSCIEPKGNHQSQGSAVAGQSLVAGHGPMGLFVSGGNPHQPRCPAFRIGRFLDGQQHLNGVGQEVVWLVEQAVAQTGARQNADEAVHEHGFELLFADALLLVELVHEQVYGSQAQTPAERIPSDGQNAQVDGYDIGVPVYEKSLHDAFLLVGGMGVGG